MIICQFPPALAGGNKELQYTPALAKKKSPIVNSNFLFLLKPNIIWHLFVNGLRPHSY
jgi:hypothetical protein